MEAVFFSDADVALPLVARHNFNVTWDTKAGKWSGTLTVPQGGIYNDSVTEGEDSAMFGLLQQLDRKFRGMEEVPAPDSPAAASVRPLPGDLAGETVFFSTWGTFWRFGVFAASPRGFDSSARGVDFLRLLLEFGNRVLHPLGPGRVILVGQMGICTPAGPP